MEFGIRYGQPTWIVARDPERGYVLRGGMGALGVGEMWFKEIPEHKELPGYADADIRSSEGGFGTESMMEELDKFWDDRRAALASRSQSVDDRVPEDFEEPHRERD
jgi:hypothetical protein